MLNSETIEKLRNMKLRGMAETLKIQTDDPTMQELSFDERFGLLADAKIHEAQKRSVTEAYNRRCA